MNQQTLKTYTYTLDQNFNLTCVSCVEDPAMEVSYDFFDKQDAYEEINGNVMGIIAKADTPILRYDYATGEYYQIVFSKDTCNELARQLIRKGAPLSLDHTPSGTLNAELTGVFQTNKYFKYKDCPEGSVVVSYRSTPDVINALKERNGFSIEVFYGSLHPYSKVDECLSLIDNL